MIIILTCTHTDVHEGGLKAGDLRLVDDIANGIGAVEIYVGATGWSPFCPDEFDNGDAAVLCKQFGYESGTALTFL